jgi:hypothetical protein
LSGVLVGVDAQRPVLATTIATRQQVDAQPWAPTQKARSKREHHRRLARAAGNCTAHTDDWN